MSKATLLLLKTHLPDKDKRAAFPILTKQTRSPLKMLPLKLLRSLVLGESISSTLSPSHSRRESSLSDGGTDEEGDGEVRERPPGSRSRRRRRRRARARAVAGSRTPLLLFLPTRELITDTYTLAHIARDMGMDLHPTPSLSHLVFTFPSPSPSQSPSPSSSSTSPLSSFPSSWSSTSLTPSAFLFPNDAVSLPFPALSSASVSALRSFVALSKGLFKLVFVRLGLAGGEPAHDGAVNWDCCSAALFSRVGGERIDTMDGFSRTLAGHGWTLFKTRKNPDPGGANGKWNSNSSVYLFRKVDLNRVRMRRAGRAPDERNAGGDCRVRELRLPPLDFGNAPLRILQYVLLMTDDIFYLA